MRILELDLLAFGPFTDTSFDFAGAGEGLHIVYGPNEAGKSTTLRALRGLLFGIESRSPDDHVHPYPDLRIGATLRFADGEVLKVVRRKGNKNTLRDGSDTNPVAGDVLAKALGSIDEAAFAMRFGLSHRALVEGGAEIAGGEGDVGAALFSASAGVAHLSALQAKLRDDAEALYKPQARILKINAALAEYKEAVQTLRGIQLSADDWLRRERELAAAKAEFAAIETELAGVDAARTRVARFQAALPLASRRAAKLAELAEIGVVPTLSGDFAVRREQAAKRLQSATEAKTRAEQELERIGRRLAELGDPPAILEHAAAVDAVCRELSSHVKAAKDRVGLAHEQERLERQFHLQLEKIGRPFCDADTLQVVVRTADRARIEELGEQFRGISTGRDRAEHRRIQLERRIAEAQGELARQGAVGDDEALKRLLKRVQPLVHAEAAHTVEATRLAADDEQLTVDTARLARWDRDLDALERTSVPATDAIQHYEARMAAERGWVGKALQERDSLAGEVASLRRELAALQGSRQAPTEDDLGEARRTRDAAWRAVCDAISAGDLASARSRATGLEPLVARADDLADRMRRDADAVARRSSLESELSRKTDALAEAAKQLSRVEEQYEASEREWTALWQAGGVSPGAPREMLAWVGERQRLCDRAAALRQRRAEHAALGRQLEAAREEAAAALTALGGRIEGSSLAHAAEALEAIRDQIETRRGLRQALEASRADAARELADVNEEAARGERELRVWRDAWAAAVEPLGHEPLGHEPRGHDEELTPAQAQALLAAHAELRNLLEKRTEGAGRIAGIDRDAGEYALRVADVARRVEPEFSARATNAEDIRAVETLVEAWGARLIGAREADGERRKHVADRKHNESELARFRQDVDAAEGTMAALCREAGADSADDLPAIEERWRRRAELQRQLAEVDEALLAQTAGAGLGEFLDDLARIEPDGLPGEEARLAARQRGLAERLDGLRKQIWDLEREAQANAGRNDAAVANAQLQEQKAQLEGHVAQYSQLKLASTVLRLAIERYRKANEAPLLTRASGIFSRLTCGEFSELRADHDDEKPVLVAVRGSSGKYVRVAGMSDGTCDQLYLALRLAAVEQYLENHPPIPFVVDDVLQRFDDGRAAAALAAFAELARKTQVIYFTHHRHVLDLAAEHLPSDAYGAHLLGDAEREATPRRERKRGGTRTAEATLFGG